MEIWKLTVLEMIFIKSRFLKYIKLFTNRIVKNYLIL